MLIVLLSMVISGAVVGGLGRLLLPGRQDIGWFATIATGIVASALATLIAYLLGFHGKTWLVIVVQLVLAVVGVGIVANRQAKKTAS
jgi:uncharacterized membrane protein YeaQ/YmgE (transglycosylase-associated protein family)